jgi:hypothetical protein
MYLQVNLRSKALAVGIGQSGPRQSQTCKQRTLTSRRNIDIMKFHWLAVIVLIGAVVALLAAVSQYISRIKNLACERCSYLRQ